MSAEMLDRLQDSKLRAMDEFIEKCSISVAGSSDDDRASAIADFIADEAIGLQHALVRFWEYYWTAALAGQIADRKAEGASIRTYLERGASCLERAAAVARKGAEQSSHEVARLNQLEEQCKAFPIWIEECMARWELLDRPVKPLDRDQVKEAHDAFARGEYEPVETMLARVQAGGQLVQE
jgi:hypothetical protein